MDDRTLLTLAATRRAITRAAAAIGEVKKWLMQAEIDELRAALAEYKAKVTELEAQEAELCTLYALSQEECKKMQAKLDAQMSPVDYVKSLNERAKP